MKTVELYGENYSGKWVRSRTACRGVVLREGKTICEGWADDLREEHGCSLADLLRGFL